MNVFARKCIDLRQKGHTLGEITKITGRPKGTVYFHIKNIELSPLLLRRINKNRRLSARANSPKKGRSLLNRHAVDFSAWTPRLVNIFAHVIFDGSIRKTGILYYNRSEALLANFKRGMKQIYPYIPRVYTTSGGVIRLAYHNVELYTFFREKCNELVSIVAKLDPQIQREFLKAFFDDEGSVDFRLSKNIRRVRGYQKSKKILDLVVILLSKFGITTSLSYKFGEITITGRKNLELFADKINFSPKIFVNGERSNSIWKKSLEKRAILASALTSYKR